MLQTYYFNMMAARLIVLQVILQLVACALAMNNPYSLQVCISTRYMHLIGGKLIKHSFHLSAGG